MKLALFDLDHTLINGDSDTSWANYLMTRGVLDPVKHKAQSDTFYQHYLEGGLDIQAWLRFQLEPLSRYPLETLHAWRRDFVETCIRPLVLEEGLKAIARHRDDGAEVVMITATNDFVTEPIAELLGVSVLIATQAEREQDGRYTGRPYGTPSFREGKIARLNEWLSQQGKSLTQYSDTWFYSDSHNDIPLLSMVKTPVAVNPDATLLNHARQLGWAVADFKREGIPAA